MKLKPVHKVQLQYSDGILISGISQDEKDVIKRDLTYDNPLYATTQRYSKYAYTTVPPYLTYYQERENKIKVPIGYDISKSIPDAKFDCKDLRVYERIETAPFVLDLRGSQKEAAESYLKLNSESTTLRGSVQMPTGKGKSILGLYIASQLSCKTLIVVHKDDLVTGWKKDIDLAFAGKVNPGLIKAKSRRVGHFITIATIQTLNRLSFEELEDLYSQFGFVIQDEMHHCPANTFGLVSKFNARYRLGLTATPERTDGLAHVMNLYFGDFCYKYKATKDDEDILPVQVIVRNMSSYFDPICKASRAGNRTVYKISELTPPEGKKLAEKEKRLSEIAYDLRPKVSFQTVDDFAVKSVKEEVCKDIIEEYDKGHSCVVFFTQKEHCRIYYEELVQSVSPSHIAIYFGDNKNNDEVLRNAEKTRKFITLTTYAKATEGTNVKQWEVEFLVSSVNNEKNVEQAAGRIRRVKKDCKINPVKIYDYRFPKVYSLSRHGRTRDSRYRKLNFSYLGETKKRGLFSRGF